jgi:hypothetical protein
MKDDEDIRVVIPRDLTTKKADSRGRITLGTEYSHREVTVAILDVSDDDTE